MPKIEEAAAPGTGSGPPPGASAWMQDLKDVQEPVAEAFVMIHRVLDRLQESHRVLQESGARKLQSTNVKLQEVSSATETAAMDIMDGVGRALELVDRVEAEQAPSGASGELRDELFGIMNLLQFQDITTQQLQYTSSLLDELENDLLEFMSRLGSLDLPSPAAAGPTAGPGERPVAFDPLATMRDAETRQAAADELLLSHDTPTAA